MAGRRPEPGKPFIPLSGRMTISLPPGPPEAVARLERVREARQAGTVDGLAALEEMRAVAAEHPTLLDAWATLGEFAADQGLWVEAFAFFRVAYHRGMDRLRALGWGGTGLVPWSDENNRPFLRGVYGLMRASEALGETEEVTRLRRFQVDLDPADHFGVGEAVGSAE